MGCRKQLCKMPKCIGKMDDIAGENIGGLFNRQ